MSGRKDGIARAFSSAAGSYEGAARLQRLVAERLADRICRRPLPADPHVLEIGCGTGLLSRALLSRIAGGEWLLTDLSPGMIERSRASIDAPRVTWGIMDGEFPEFCPSGFDLIVSSLAFQWFGDLNAAIARLAALLAPGGALVFATMGRDSFLEWRRAHDELGLPCGTPAYPGAEQIAWPSGGRGRVEEEHIPMDHPDAHSFARGLKDIGAQTPHPGYRPLAPGAFRKVLRRLGDSATVTYHILYGSFEAEPCR
ncbi:methyltransferase domain-containing protein [Telmatospirillum sp. J64-1]|uniref:methyltransferase domain-containing protein n=1 Tax=Telmatospirillum sp. J64-1 TaxID=2502183 RepID=UPI00163D49D4|nr:methyltransferase domain-containing protein [Telmatospirillum sp. J64-1]